MSWATTSDYSKRWYEALLAREAGDTERAKRIAKELTTGYVGLTDAPHSMFVLELAEIYPNAKVVVVERDPASWWRSINGVMAHIENPLLPILAYPKPGFRYFPYVFRQWKREQMKLCEQAGVKFGPGECYSCSCLSFM
jgi:hypothetical protein